MPDVIPFVGVELIDDPARVPAVCQARDAAWHAALPAAQFEARVGSRA